MGGHGRPTKSRGFATAEARTSVHPNGCRRLATGQRWGAWTTTWRFIPRATGQILEELCRDSGAQLPQRDAGGWQPRQPIVQPGCLGCAHHSTQRSPRCVECSRAALVGARAGGCGGGGTATIEGRRCTRQTLRRRSPCADALWSRWSSTKAGTSISCPSLTGAGHAKQPQLAATWVTRTRPDRVSLVASSASRRGPARVCSVGTCRAGLDAAEGWDDDSSDLRPIGRG